MDKGAIERRVTVVQCRGSASTLACADSCPLPGRNWQTSDGSPMGNETMRSRVPAPLREVFYIAFVSVDTRN